MSDSLSHSCPTCGGTGKSRCRLCKEVHRGVPPYIGCTGGDCPDCIEGYPKDRIERAEAAVMELIHNEIGLPHSANVDDYLDPESKGEIRQHQLEMLRLADEEADQRNRELIRLIALAAIRAFHTEGTDQ